MTNSLSAETAVIPLAENNQLREKSPLENRFCVYISGATGAQHTGRPIGEALETVYGKENVLVVSSTASVDIQDLKRKYPDISATIFKHIEKGEKVSLIGYSAGATEIVDILKAMEKQNPNISKWAKELEVTLAAPAIVAEGPKDILNFLGHIKDYLRDISKVGPSTGLDSLFLFPPNSDSIDFNQLKLAIRANISDRSLDTDRFNSAGFEETGFKPDKNMTQYLDKEAQRLNSEEKRDLRKEVEIIDQKLFDARGDRKLFLHLLTQRANLLAKPLQEAFDTMVVNTLPLALKTYAQILRGYGNLFLSAAKGDIVKSINKLRDNGATISFVAPEYDNVFPLTDVRSTEYIQKLTGTEDITAAVVGIELSKHPSWVMNPIVFAEAMRRVSEQNLLRSNSRSNQPLVPT